MKMACLFAFPAALAMLCSCGAVEEQEAEALEPSPLPVTAAVASTDTLYEVIEVSGRIASARTQDLVAQIQGVISEAPGFEGMPVGEGEVLFRIASGSAGAELSAAYAEYQRSQAVYQFECDNYDGELTDQVSRMLRATTGLDNAEAALARARTGYGNATLTAGFDGLVSGVEVREGMTVYPGTVLGSLVDPTSLRAEVDLDERQLSLRRRVSRLCHAAFPRGLRSGRDRRERLARRRSSPPGGHRDDRAAACRRTASRRHGEAGDCHRRPPRSRRHPRGGGARARCT